MSEYQYYEFQARDRPLTQHDMREARAGRCEPQRRSAHRPDGHERIADEEKIAQVSCQAGREP
jgi:hypothetical protein